MRGDLMVWIQKILSARNLTSAVSLGVMEETAEVLAITRVYSKINCMELNYLLKQAFVLHQSRSYGYASSSSLAFL